MFTIYQRDDEVEVKFEAETIEELLEKIRYEITEERAFDMLSVVLSVFPRDGKLGQVIEVQNGTPVYWDLMSNGHTPGTSH